LIWSIKLADKNIYKSRDAWGGGVEIMDKAKGGIKKQSGMHFPSRGIDSISVFGIQEKY